VLKKTTAEKQAELNHIIDWVWDIAIGAKNQGEAYDAEKQIASLRRQIGIGIMGLKPSDL